MRITLAFRRIVQSGQDNGDDHAIRFILVVAGEKQGVMFVRSLMKKKTGNKNISRGQAMFTAFLPDRDKNSRSVL